ncbi:MAG: hypothetical protein P4M00_24630 [Azospirillaceae bacterium]|nr:hypothetical protein [Azospirillaceae bacterium]
MSIITASKAALPPIAGQPGRIVLKRDINFAHQKANIGRRIRLLYEVEITPLGYVGRPKWRLPGDPAVDGR